MFIKGIIKALINPSKGDYNISFLKFILMKPRIYSLVSFLMQWVDLTRQSKIVEVNQADQHFKKVHEYNAGVTLNKQIATTRRPEEYFKFIESLPNRSVDEKILLIGPRSIFELYLAWLHGFKWSNVYAIDLFSTNKKIQIMNMENMTFKNETFDYVFMSRVYGYAKDPEKCISESARVLKDNGHLIFEANYFPEDKAWPVNTLKGKDTVEFLNKNHLYVTIHRYDEKVNALGKKQGIHKICAKKDTHFSQRLDILTIS